jgi:hypothetical protein
LQHDIDSYDEIYLLIGNLVLGEGVPVFVGKTPTSLRLIDIRRWEDSDNVLLRYEVRHKSVYLYQSDSQETRSSIGIQGKPWR